LRRGSLIPASVLVAALSACRAHHASALKDDEAAGAGPVATGELAYDRLAMGQGSMIHRVLPHPRDPRFIVVTDKEAVSLWNVSTREAVWRQPVEALTTNPIVVGAINHAGTLFALGGFFNPYLELRRLEDGEIARVLPLPPPLPQLGGPASFPALAFSEDDRYLLAADSRHGRLYLYDLETGEIARTFRGLDGLALAVGFNVAMDRIYAVCDNYLKIWNTEGDDDYWFKRISPAPLAPGGPTPPLIMAGTLSRNLQFATLTVGTTVDFKTVQIFDLQSEEMVAQFTAGGPIYKASVSDDLRTLSFFEGSGRWQTYAISSHELLSDYHHPDWQNGAVWYAGVPLPHAFDKDLTRYFTPDGVGDDGHYAIRAWTLPPPP
jgi:WD40 repeat protein